MSNNPWDDDPISGSEKPSSIADTVSKPVDKKPQLPQVVEPAQPEQDPFSGLGDDPLGNQGIAGLLTRAQAAGASAQNSAIRAAVAKAKPSGKNVMQADGTMKWVPDQVEVPPVVQAQGKSASEIKLISDTERRLAGADQAGVTADLANQQWRSNIKGDFLADFGSKQKDPDDNIGEEYLSLLSLEADKLREQLVREGYANHHARTIAQSVITKAFLDNFRVNTQTIGRNRVAKANDFMVIGGGGGSGAPMTPDEIKAQKPTDIEPEDRNRGFWSNIFNGGADIVTPGDMAANTEFRNTIRESTGKLPNMSTKSKDYLESGEKWLLENANTDIQGLANFVAGGDVEKAQAAVQRLMFLEDIRQHGVANGYAKKLPDGSVIRQQITQEEIDSSIVPQIEALKKLLTGLR
jgi:hypothetical protein